MLWILESLTCWLFHMNWIFLLLSFGVYCCWLLKLMTRLFGDCVMVLYLLYTGSWSRTVFLCANPDSPESRAISPRVNALLYEYYFYLHFFYFSEILVALSMNNSFPLGLLWRFFAALHFEIDDVLQLSYNSLVYLLT